MISILLDYLAAERDSKVDLHIETFAEMLVYDGKHTIHRSVDPEKCFSGVWSDMGIEQSIDRDSGIIGELTAIKTHKAAMDRWYLTAHLKANIVSAFFSMLGLDDENQSSAHKESTM